ncbi:amidohydrolase family protein [Streptomyces sp. NPDC058290]|uniref:amidohydrolase family protein n=1 Tax=Streptomyces sp. NPDC058290 TaxID=3346426 RepID=UPI0036E6ACCB
MSPLRIDVHAHLWTAQYLQVLSVAPQSPHLARESDAVAVARTANEAYAELVARHPGRFRAFAALPLPHVDAALREIAHAFDDLGAVGAGVTTTVLGRTLDDPLFRPVYEELDRRGAVLSIHPAGEGAGSPLITEHGMTWMVGAPVEDTVALMHLILAGIPARHPGMRILDGEVFLRAVDYVRDAGLTREEAAMILDTNAAGLLGLTA